MMYLSFFDSCVVMLCVFCGIVLFFLMWEWFYAGLFFFFFKQKTAYDVRISDWSSDVCSSDLIRRPARPTSTGATARTPSCCARTSPRTARPTGSGSAGRPCSGRMEPGATALRSVSSPTRTMVALLAADPVAGRRFGLHLRPHLVPPLRVLRACQVGGVGQGGVRFQPVVGASLGEHRAHRLQQGQLRRHLLDEPELPGLVDLPDVRLALAVDGQVEAAEDDTKFAHHPPEPVFAAVRELGRLCVQRSEEHTSELQSLMRISYAVFCLKKKKQTYNKSRK